MIKNSLHEHNNYLVNYFMNTIVIIKLILQPLFYFTFCTEFPLFLKFKQKFLLVYKYTFKSKIFTFHKIDKISISIMNFVPLYKIVLFVNISALITPNPFYFNYK